jgi:hypothetical protein
MADPSGWRSLAIARPYGTRCLPLRSLSDAVVWYGAASRREWEANAGQPRPLDAVIAPRLVERLQKLNNP